MQQEKKEVFPSAFAVAEALNNPTRFQMFEQMFERNEIAYTVGEAAELAGIPQGHASFCIASLEKAGLVKTRKAGRKTIVTLSPNAQEVFQRLDWLESIAVENKKAMAETVENYEDVR